MKELGDMRPKKYLKLTPEQRVDLKKQIQAGENWDTLQENFKISRSTIYFYKDKIYGKNQAGKVKKKYIKRKTGPIAATNKLGVWKVEKGLSSGLQEGESSQSWEVKPKPKDLASHSTKAEPSTSQQSRAKASTSSLADTKPPSDPSPDLIGTMSPRAAAMRASLEIRLDNEFMDEAIPTPKPKSKGRARPASKKRKRKQADNPKAIDPSLPVDSSSPFTTTSTSGSTPLVPLVPVVVPVTTTAPGKKKRNRAAPTKGVPRSRAKGVKAGGVGRSRVRRPINVNKSEEPTTSAQINADPLLGLSYESVSTASSSQKSRTGKRTSPGNYARRGGFQRPMNVIRAPNLSHLTEMTRTGEFQQSFDGVNMDYIDSEGFVLENNRAGERTTPLNPLHSAFTPILPKSPNQLHVQHNYHSRRVLEALMNDEAFVDVTLTAEGKPVSAHKLVLSAMSPYFQRVLQANPCKHPVVIMPPSVSFNHLSHIISFMYKGETTVLESELRSLIRTAELLQVSGFRVAGSSNPPPPPFPEDSPASGSSFSGFSNPTVDDRVIRITEEREASDEESFRAQTLPRQPTVAQSSPLRRPGQPTPSVTHVFSSLNTPTNSLGGSLHPLNPPTQPINLTSQSPFNPTSQTNPQIPTFFLTPTVNPVLINGRTGSIIPATNTAMGPRVGIHARSIIHRAPGTLLRQATDLRGGRMQASPDYLSGDTAVLGVDQDIDIIKEEIPYEEEEEEESTVFVMENWSPQPSPQPSALPSPQPSALPSPQPSTSAAPSPQTSPRPRVKPKPHSVKLSVGNVAEDTSADAIEDGPLSPNVTPPLVQSLSPVETPERALSPVETPERALSPIEMPERALSPGADVLPRTKKPRPSKSRSSTSRKSTSLAGSPSKKASKRIKLVSSDESRSKSRTPTRLGSPELRSQTPDSGAVTPSMVMSPSPRSPHSRSPTQMSSPDKTSPMPTSRSPTPTEPMSPVVEARSPTPTKDSSPSSETKKSLPTKTLSSKYKSRTPSPTERISKKSLSTKKDSPKSKSRTPSPTEFMSEKSVPTKTMSSKSESRTPSPTEMMSPRSKSESPTPTKSISPTPKSKPPTPTPTSQMESVSSLPKSPKSPSPTKMSPERDTTTVTSPPPKSKTLIPTKTPDKNTSAQSPTPELAEMHEKDDTLITSFTPKIQSSTSTEILSSAQDFTVTSLSLTSKIPGRRRSRSGPNYKETAESPWSGSRSPTPPRMVLRSPKAGKMRLRTRKSKRRKSRFTRSSQRKSQSESPPNTPSPDSASSEGTISPAFGTGTSLDTTPPTKVKKSSASASSLWEHAASSIALNSPPHPDITPPSTAIKIKLSRVAAATSEEEEITPGKSVTPTVEMTPPDSNTSPPISSTPSTDPSSLPPINTSSLTSTTSPSSTTKTTLTVTTCPHSSTSPLSSRFPTTTILQSTSTISISSLLPSAPHLPLSSRMLPLPAITARLPSSTTITPKPRAMKPTTTTATTATPPPPLLSNNPPLLSTTPPLFSSTPPLFSVRPPFGAPMSTPNVPCSKHSSSTNLSTFYQNPATTSKNFAFASPRGNPQAGNLPGHPSTAQQSNMPPHSHHLTTAPPPHHPPPPHNALPPRHPLPPHPPSHFPPPPHQPPPPHHTTAMQPTSPHSPHERRTPSHSPLLDLTVCRHKRDSPLLNAPRTPSPNTARFVHNPANVMHPRQSSEYLPGPQTVFTTSAGTHYPYITTTSFQNPQCTIGGVQSTPITSTTIFNPSSQGRYTPKPQFDPGVNQIRPQATPPPKSVYPFMNAPRMDATTSKAGSAPTITATTTLGTHSRLFEGSMASNSPDGQLMIPSPSTTPSSHDPGTLPPMPDSHYMGGHHLAPPPPLPHPPQPMDYNIQPLQQQVSFYDLDAHAPVPPLPPLPPRPPLIPDPPYNMPIQDQYNYPPTAPPENYGPMYYQPPLEASRTYENSPPTYYDLDSSPAAQSSTASPAVPSPTVPSPAVPSPASYDFPVLHPPVTSPLYGHPPNALPVDASPSVPNLLAGGDGLYGQPPLSNSPAGSSPFYLDRATPTQSVDSPQQPSESVDASPVNHDPISFALKEWRK